MENFNAKEYRDNLSKDLKEIRKTDREKAQVVLADVQESREYKLSKKFKNKETPSSQYITNESIKKIGEQFVLVKEIILPDKLKEKLESRYGIDERSQNEFFDYFYEITNGRYPNYTTLNHVIGGGDRASNGMKYLNTTEGKDLGYGTTREIERNYGLEDKDIETLFEMKTDVKRGFCCGMGYSYHFATVFSDSWVRRGNQSETTLYNNKNKPLLIFGSQNKKFLDFIDKKYAPVYRALGIKNAEDFVNSDYVKNRQEVSEKIPTGPFSNQYEREDGKTQEIVANLNNLTKDSLMYNFDSSYHYSGNKGFSPEADFYVANNMPVCGWSWDGTFISSNIKEYHEKLNKIFNLNIETKYDETLNFNDAEMMIDLHGLYDGKPKIIDFSFGSEIE